MGTSGFSLQVIDWMEKLQKLQKSFWPVVLIQTYLLIIYFVYSCFYFQWRISRKTYYDVQSLACLKKNLRQSSIIPSFFYDTEWCYSWRDTGSDLWKVMILWSWRLTTYTTDNKVHLDSTIVSLYSLWAH